MRPRGRSVRHRRHPLATCVLLCLCAGLSACAGPPPAPPPDQPVPGADRPRTLPPSAELLARANARVADLDRLRTPVTLIIDRPGERAGARAVDQVEGTFQTIRPDRVSLRLDKVGQTLLVLGSDDQRYWWVDFSAEAPRAAVGTLARATPEKARSLGVPVHPLDLLDLAAITPLPAETTFTLERDRIKATAPSRWGRRVLYLAPDTLEPEQVWLIGADGRVAVWARLSRYQPVPVVGNAFSAARLPARVDALVPESDVTITMAVIEPENPGASMRTGQFDLARVLASYNVRDVTDLDRDDPPASAPTSAPAGEPAPDREPSP